METSAREVGMGEVEGRGSKRRSREEERGKREEKETEKPEEGEDSGS